MGAQLTSPKTIHSIAVLRIFNTHADEDELIGQRTQTLQDAFEWVKYVIIDDMLMIRQRILDTWIGV